MRRVRPAILVAVVVAVVAGGCGGGTSTSAKSTATTNAPSTSGPSGNSASAIGITPSQVTVGNVSVLSGPIPGLFQGAPTGASAFFNYINSQGGVNGRKIAL